jgi:hypothetical protein
VSLSALSLTETYRPELYGDWGNEASIALLASATVYAVGLNVPAVTATPQLRDPERGVLR